MNNQLVVETLRMRVACHELQLTYMLDNEDKMMETEVYEKVVHLRKAIKYYQSKFSQADFEEYNVLERAISEADKTVEIERARRQLLTVVNPSHQLKEFQDFFAIKENADKADKRRELAIENLEVLKNMLDTQR